MNLRRLLSPLWSPKQRAPDGAPRRRHHPFELDYPLMRWSQTDLFRLRDAVTHTLVFGGTGSGKTSGVYRSFLRAFFRSGYGGLILITKPGEYEEVRRWAEETGRLDDLIRFAPEEKHRFGFMTYLSALPGRGGSQTENIVKTLTTIQESFDRSGRSGGGDTDRYFRLANEQLLRNAIDLFLIARPGEPISVRSIFDVIMSAATSPEQVDAEAWQLRSLCYRLLDQALNRDSLSPQQRSDLDITGRYFLQEFPSLPQDTRGSIVSTFTTMADIFLRGEIGNLFSTSLNVVPEVAHEGGIIVIDLPVKTFGQVGIATQTVWKYLFQLSCERRDVNRNPASSFSES